MLLCREMSSVSNEQTPGTLCAEGTEHQPPKHDCRFCEKPAHFSLLLLTPLKCPYKTVASDQIFSLASPYRMAVRACGYLPRSGVRGPQSWKKLALCRNSVCVIFSPFLAYAVSFWSTVGLQNFGRGRNPLPEMCRKNGVCCKAYILSTGCTARCKWPPTGETAVQLLINMIVQYQNNKMSAMQYHAARPL